MGVKHYVYLPLMQLPLPDDLQAIHSIAVGYGLNQFFFIYRPDVTGFQATQSLLGLFSFLVHNLSDTVMCIITVSRPFTCP